MSLPKLNTLVDQANEFLGLSQPYYQAWDICTRVLNGEPATNPGPSSAFFNIANSVNLAASNNASFNLLLEPYRVLYSQLLTNLPAPIVTPASEDPEDIQRALTLGAMLRWWSKTERFDQKLNNGLGYLLTTGSMGLTLYQNGENTHFEVLSPYDILFEPAVMDWRDSRWVCIRRYATRQELMDRFPDHAYEIERVPTPGLTTSQQTSAASTNQTQPRDRIEYWEVYSRDPDESGDHAAQFLIPSARMSLWEGAVPAYPFSLVRYTPIAKRLWGKGVIEPAVEPARFFNLMLTYQLYNAELTGNPLLLVHNEDLATAQEIANTPGGIVRWGSTNGNPSVPPQYLNPPGMPAYAQAIPQTMQGLVMDAMGIHATSLGKRQSGVNSGKAIEALTQNDASQMDLTLSAIAESVTEICTAALKYFRAYMSEQKAIRISDEYGQLFYLDIHQTDLQGDPNPEVVVESSSLFRQSAAEVRNNILRDMQMGLLTQEEAQKKIRKLIPAMPDVDYMRAVRHAKDILAAVIELRAPPKFYRTDNHKVLREVFDRYMQSPEFYRTDPDVQELINASYEDLLASEAQAQQPYTPPVRNTESSASPGLPANVAQTADTGAEQTEAMAT